MILTGGQVVIEALKREGVDTVFGYPGGVALPLYDCLYESGIRHILPRHEQGAVHAADGYARVSGKVGVCFATSGPGATNLVTGIATANMDSVPIVCITCQVSLPLLGKDSFQEADITGITTPITKHNFMVRDYRMLPEALAKAFYIARTGRPGPVLVDIPKDVLTQKMDMADYPRQFSMRGYRPVLRGDNADVKTVADALAAAQKPLFFIGGGCISAGVGAQVQQLIEQTGVPYVSSLMGLSATDKYHPLNLGMIGMHGTYAANMAACSCDLLIGLGVRFDDRVTGAVSHFAPNARIAHFDVDSSEMGKIVKVDYRVLGDLRWSVPQLLSVAQTGDLSEWQQEVKDLADNYPLRYEDNAQYIKPQAVIERVNQYLSGDAVIVTDVGQHQMWSAQYAHIKGPGRFLSSGGLGTMGYGLPAAIGAAVACPEQDVWLITGDGCMMMNCQEIATAVEENCRIKVVILNNNGLGMVRQWQRLFYENRYSGSRHEKPTDYARLAQAMDAEGINVTKREELDAALEKARQANGPIFINVRVDDDENVLPMVAPNSALHQMYYE